jgi:hypothetical protein
MYMADEKPKQEKNEKEKEKFDSGYLAAMLKNPIQIAETNDEDTLVDIHVNNPLKRIMKLLEEIKRQKAFSFTLQGSLGIAGIALIVTSFGIFGGTKAFCAKGVQTHIGSFRVLKITEKDTSTLPLIEKLQDVIWKIERPSVNRMVMIKSDNSILHITKLNKSDAKQLLGKEILVTGDYDNCTQTVTLTDANSVEVYH